MPHFTQSRLRLASILLALIALGLFRSSADTIVATLSAGTNTQAIVVNPLTNKIYAANYGSANVTVIDGATNSTSTVSVGTNPVALAVNTLTNKIYVANSGSATVTVIDGATNATVTVNAGTTPNALAVNPVTNQVYVANKGASVTVINGATNAALSLSTGPETFPCAIAVNPLTNKIYVADGVGASVTVIDGATNATTSVSVPGNGANATAVAVNPVTNKIYVSNNSDDVPILIIDGATGAPTSLYLQGENGAAVTGIEMTVNPVTNKIYFNSGGVSILDGANDTDFQIEPVFLTEGLDMLDVFITGQIAANPATNKLYAPGYVSGLPGGSITIIDAATNIATTLTTPNSTFAAAVNPVTNKTYVTSPAGFVTVIDGSSNAVSTINVGSNPKAAAVNFATNITYLANYGSNSVTVIDGATKTTSTVNVGTNPTAVDVNPLTNQIYVANFGGNNVSVIDGATNAVSSVNTGGNPAAIAVNAVTDLIYVANNANIGAGGVTVINGANNTAVATVAAGANPIAVAVNPATNVIYVANNGSATVTVIDGATNATSTISVGTDPVALAVNRVTNQIYVANNGSGNVTVIDGATNAVSATITVGTQPIAVAVNPLTNQVYVANNGNANVTVINGATNTVTGSVTAGATPSALALNSATNQIYVANNGGGTVTMIDGTTNTAATINVGAGPSALALNPMTNELYVANFGSRTASVITPVPANPTRVTGIATAIALPTGHVTFSATPTFSFQAISLFSPAAPPVEGIFYQLDATTGPWQALASVRNSASATLPSLVRGPHTLFAFATDGQEATSINFAGSPVIGAVTAYSFVYGDTTPVASAQTIVLVKGASAPVTLSGAGLNPLTYAIAAQPTYGTLSGTAPNLTYTTNDATYIGSDSFAFTVNDGVQNSAPATVTLQIIDDVPVAISQSLGTSRGVPVPLTLTGSALDPLTYTVVTPPAHGGLSGTAPQLTYTPNATFVGNDTFTFQVDDGYQNSVPASVAIAVVETGTPLAAAQSVTVERSAQIGITLGGSSSFPLTYTVATQPAYGILTGVAPALTYTAGTTYAGNDSFTFTVNDGVETSPPATVNISILDSPPVGVNDVFYTASASLAPLTLDVLANDSDAEGRPLTITAVSRAGEGKVSVASGNLSLVYQPDVAFANSGRADTFTYTVSNGDKTATALVTVVNPFAHHQGNFGGLVVDGVQNAGCLALTSSGAGGFTGSLNLDGVISPLRGAFASNGRASITIKRKKPRPAVSLQLQFNDATGNTITASLMDGAAGYTGVLEPQVAISTQNPAAQAGSYTVMISIPTPPSSSLPGGTGYGILKATTAGLVTLTGKLGDATPFSCSGFLRADGTFPIYVALNAKTVPGSLWGVGAFQDAPDVSDLSATLQWNKAAQSTGALYRVGFNTQVTLLGSYYRFTKGAQTLSFTNSTSGAAAIKLGGGNLAAPLQDIVSVSPANAVKEQPPTTDHLELTITAKTGLIIGSFLPSSSSHATGAIGGVVFQKQNLAAGLFTGPTLTGAFALNPQ